MPRTLVALVLLVLIAPTAWALDPLGAQNDAGSGRDAPDDSASALLLAEGEHTGTLTSLADRIDWYAATVGPLQKLQVDFRATSGVIWFRALDDAGQHVFQTISSGEERRYLGHYGVAHRFEFDPAYERTHDITYWFRVTLLQGIPQNDAGIGRDATGDVHVAAGEHAGTLHPASMDLEDWYAFSKPWGAWVNVTLTSEAGKPVTFEVRSAHGAIVGAVSDGEPVSLETGLDARTLRVRTTEGAPTTDYTFSIAWFVPGPAPPLDDAGLGIDAPAGWTDLPVLTDGTYEGRVDYVRSDDVDRFAFYSPPGKYLQVTFELLDGTGTAAVAVDVDETTREAWRGLRDGDSVTFDSGTGLRILTIEKWWPTSGYSGGPIPSAEALYRFTVRAVDPPDLEIGELRADPPGTGFSAFTRRVHSEVVNPSDAIATTTVTVSVVDSAGLSTTLGKRTVTLAPHSSAQFTDRWTIVGYVGEFTVRVVSECPLDPNAANSVKEIRASGIVDPGLGVGAGATVVIFG